MEHYDWNDGWLFAPTFDPAIVRPECTGVELEPVRLPHTVKTLPYNYCNENEYQRVSGYRREFFAPKEWQGRTVLLTFGAVAHDATVFCNGRRVFHHGCGYTAFTVDLTESLLLGQKNVVAVRCDSREDLNIPPFGGQIDFLTYGGIYRAVSLDVKEPAYLRDIFIEAQAEGDFRIYSSTVGETIGCTLQAEIRSPAGSRALYSGELSLPIVGTLNGVHPWSVEHPFLYTLTVRLIRPGTSGLPDRVLDEKSTRFGFRTIQFVAGGFYLNGQRVELRGLNRHQSYAYQGYAMPDSIQQLDAQLLKKQLGCNAVRTSHYPQSPAFLDACDELGLLVFVEMPGWQHIGDEAWQAQALQNCREMVCQCRNHPSVFLWGVRVNGSSDNEAFYKRTNEAVHRLDPTRPTGGVRIARKSQLLEDVYAYNDYSYSGRGPGCEPRSAVTPDLRKGYLISEFGGQQFPAKAFDDEPHRLAQALRYAAVLNDSIAQQGVAFSVRHLGLQLFHDLANALARGVNLLLEGLVVLHLFDDEHVAQRLGDDVAVLIDFTEHDHVGHVLGADLVEAAGNGAAFDQGNRPLQANEQDDQGKNAIQRVSCQLRDESDQQRTDHSRKFPEDVIESEKFIRLLFRDQLTE